MSIFAGIIIVILSLYLIRKEVMKASFFKHVKVDGLTTNDNQLIEYVQNLEKTIDQMNESYYDISSDLEGKYSVHEKEISLLEEKINGLTRDLLDIRKMLNIQGKEIDAFKEPINNKPQVQNTAVENDDIKQEIIRLKALGLDEYEIARRLGKGIREIKMLMNFIK